MTDAAAEKQETFRAEHERPEAPELKVAAIRSLEPRDYAVRFAFGFTISVIAGAVGLTAGPRVGGLFLAFPAVLPASVTLLARKDGIAQACSDIRGAAIGAVGMICFAGVVTAGIRGSAPLALGGALLVWMVVSTILYLGLRGLLRLLGERQYLPEIPTSEAAVAVALLRQRHLTVATAESSTGGMVAALFCALPDAGQVFRGGVVAVTDELKRKLLSVPADVLEREGPVSRGVAVAMAKGARGATGADVGVAVTGLTGGDAGGQPRGLTFIAVATPDGGVEIMEFAHDHGPGRNDERAVRMALRLIERVLEGR